MNKLYKIIACAASILLIAVSGNVAQAQSFKKGSLLVSISEGATQANYTTTNNSPYSDVINHQNIAGNRDPITIEYGLSNHFGIGLTSGTDFYNINSSSFYNFQTATGKVRAFTGEFTVDANYHFYVTRRIDLSAFSAIGFSSVYFKGNTGDAPYQYKSGGWILRAGVQAKYYILKRLGVHGMLSTFSMNCATDGVKGNTVGNNYSTTIKGYAIEFGPCYRILR